MTIEQKVSDLTDKLKKDVSGLMQLRVDIADGVQLGLFVRGSGESSLWMSKGLPSVCLSWGRLRSFVRNLSDSVVYFNIDASDYVWGGVCLSFPSVSVFFGEFFDVDSVLPLSRSDASLCQDIVDNPANYYFVGKRVDGGFSFADSIKDLSAFTNPVLRDVSVGFDTDILRDVYEYLFELSGVPLGDEFSLFVGNRVVGFYSGGVFSSDYLDVGSCSFSGKSLSLVFISLLGGELVCGYQTERAVFALSSSGTRRVFRGYFNDVVSDSRVSVFVDSVEFGSFDENGSFSGVGISSSSYISWETGEVYLEFLQDTVGSNVYFRYNVLDSLGLVSVDTFEYQGSFGADSPVVGSCRIFIDDIDGELVAVEDGGFFVGDIVAEGSFIDYSTLRFTLRLKYLPKTGTRFVMVYSTLDGYEQWSESYVELGFDLSEFRYSVGSGSYSLSRVDLRDSVLEPCRIYSSLFLKSRLTHQVVASFLVKTECMDFRYGVDVVNDDPDTFILQTLSDFKGLLGVYGSGSDDVFKSASSEYKSSSSDVWRNPFFPYTEYTENYPDFPYSGSSPLFGSQIIFSSGSVVKFRVYPDVKWTYSPNVRAGSVLPVDGSAWLNQLSSFSGLSVSNISNPPGGGSGVYKYRVAADGLVHSYIDVSGDLMDRGVLNCTYNTIYPFFDTFTKVLTFMNSVLNYTNFRDVIQASSESVRSAFDSMIRNIKTGLVNALNRVLATRSAPLTSSISMSDISLIKSNFGSLYGDIIDLLSFIDGILGYVRQRGSDTVGLNPDRRLGSYTQVLYDVCSFNVSSDSGSIGSVLSLFESIGLVVDQIESGQQEVLTWKSRM